MARHARRLRVHPSAGQRLSSRHSPSSWFSPTRSPALSSRGGETVWRRAVRSLEERRTLRGWRRAWHALHAGRLGPPLAWGIPKSSLEVGSLESGGTADASRLAACMARPTRCAAGAPTGAGGSDGRARWHRAVRPGGARGWDCRHCSRAVAHWAGQAPLASRRATMIMP